MRFAANDFAISLNGETPVGDATITLPTVTTERLGQLLDGTLQWFGHISYLAFYDAALPNAGLQALTAG